MRLLLDSCVWGKASPELRAAGHDVVWVGDWPEDPGDEEILINAHSDDRILITLDNDFGELAVARGMPHRGIVRLVNIGARSQAAACLRIIELHGKELSQGAIVTAEPGRLRIRAPNADGGQ
jgi:predicted nuclease of predicted toxin-antitoxin system